MSPTNDVLPLSPGTVVLLSAHPTTGASAWAFALAHAVATGSPFPGLAPEPARKSLFVAYARIPNASLPFASDFYIANDLPTLDADGWPFEIALFARLHRPRLIVVDPLYAATRRDLHRRRPARRFMERMRAFAEWTGACILLVHHTGHDGRTPGGCAELGLGAHASLLLDPSRGMRTPVQNRHAARVVRGPAGPASPVN